MNPNTKSKIAMVRGTFSIFLLAALIGCGKPDGTNPARDEGLPAEAVAVRKAFAGSGPGYENPVQEALNLVKAGSLNPTAYLEVIPQLQRLAGNPTITADQKQALEVLVEKLKSETVVNRP